MKQFKAMALLVIVTVVICAAVGMGQDHSGAAAVTSASGGEIELLVVERVEPPVIEYIETPVYIPVPAETQYAVFEVTAYCPCEPCCGFWALDRPNGIVYTASGAEAVEGVTVAVDTDIIPFGSLLYIEGVGLRTAQDRGGAIKGDKLDVYFDSHVDALKFGRQMLRVWILKGED